MIVLNFLKIENFHGQDFHEHGLIIVKIIFLFRFTLQSSNLSTKRLQENFGLE